MNYLKLFLSELSPKNILAELAGFALYASILSIPFCYNQLYKWGLTLKNLLTGYL